MPRPKLDVQHTSLRIYRSDLEALSRFYPRIPIAQAIRKIIQNHVRKLTEREAQTLSVPKDEDLLDDFE